MRAITPFRPPDRVVTVDWHDRAWQPRLVRVSVLDCGGNPESFRETPLSGRGAAFYLPTPLTNLNHRFSTL
jgi:hypothetical protein